MVYECDLAVFDKQSRCLLLPGQYEIPLRNFVGNFSAKKKKKKNRKEIQLTHDAHQKVPILRFRIAWTKKRYEDFVDYRLDDTDLTYVQSNQIKNVTDFHTGVNYHFFYNNNAGLLTQECNDFICPWCKINCSILFSLLMHLRLCHARFCFEFVPSSERMAKIDVCIDQMYNGSYTGSPLDNTKCKSEPDMYIFVRRRDHPLRAPSYT